MAPDTEFEDVNGQLFRKTGATKLGLSFGNRKIKKHEVVCLASPLTGDNPPGPVDGEVQKRLGAVETSTHTGLRDRALLGTLAYTFARGTGDSQSP
jgi:hypothetical protein